MRHKGTQPEEQLASMLAILGMRPEREYRFHPTRRWRFDFAFPDAKLGVEVDGGQWIPGGGRHNRAGGFQKDLEKMNAAVELGWRVLRFTPDMVVVGTAANTIERVLRG